MLMFFPAVQQRPISFYQRMRRWFTVLLEAILWRSIPQRVPAAPAFRRSSLDTYLFYQEQRPTLCVLVRNGSPFGCWRNILKKKA
jgi:hypothetical protein